MHCKRSRIRICRSSISSKAEAAPRPEPHASLPSDVRVWTAPAALALPGLSLEAVPVDRGTTMFDLTLTVTDHGGELLAAAEYNADLYDGETIARLLRHYETFLKQLTADPSLRGSAVPLADAAERQLVVDEWNSTAVDYPATGPSMP